MRKASNKNPFYRQLILQFHIAIVTLFIAFICCYNKKFTFRNRLVGEIVLLRDISVLFLFIKPKKNRNTLLEEKVKIIE